MIAIHLACQQSFPLLKSFTLVVIFIFYLFNMEYNNNEFVGVWLRMRIEEPIGEFQSDASTETILWLQSGSGLFLDIRLPIPAVTWQNNSLSSSTGQQNFSTTDYVPTYLKKVKSFGGSAAFNSELGQITWTREFDFRFPGTPDVGKVNFLDKEKSLLQEDAALEGENFREIWKNQHVLHDEINMNRTDVSYRLTWTEPETNKLNIKKGIFIAVGSFIGFAFGRDNRPECQIPEEQKWMEKFFGINSYDDDNGDDASKSLDIESYDEGKISERLLEYTCVFARQYEKGGRYQVILSVDQSLIGADFFRNDRIRGVLKTCKWNLVGSSAVVAAEENILLPIDEEILRKELADLIIN